MLDTLSIIGRSALWTLVGLILAHLIVPYTPPPCPLCGRRPRRALLGPFPLWICLHHHGEGPAPVDDSESLPCPFGLCATLALSLGTLVPGDGWTFMIASEVPFWYPRALWLSLWPRKTP